MVVEYKKGNLRDIFIFCLFNWKFFKEKKNYRNDVCLFGFK